MLSHVSDVSKPLTLGTTFIHEVDFFQLRARRREKLSIVAQEKEIEEKKTENGQKVFFSVFILVLRPKRKTPTRFILAAAAATKWKHPSSTSLSLSFSLFLSLTRTSTHTLTLSLSLFPSDRISIWGSRSERSFSACERVWVRVCACVCARSLTWNEKMSVVWFFEAKLQVVHSKLLPWPTFGQPVWNVCDQGPIQQTVVKYEYKCFSVDCRAHYFCWACWKYLLGQTDVVSKACISSSLDALSWSLNTSLEKLLGLNPRVSPNPSFSFSLSPNSLQPIVVLSTFFSVFTFVWGLSLSPDTFLFNPPLKKSVSSSHLFYICPEWFNSISRVF